MTSSSITGNSAVSTGIKCISRPPPGAGLLTYSYHPSISPKNKIILHKCFKHLSLPELHPSLQLDSEQSSHSTIGLNQRLETQSCLLFLVWGSDNQGLDDQGLRLTPGSRKRTQLLLREPASCRPFPSSPSPAGPSLGFLAQTESQVRPEAGQGLDKSPTQWLSFRFVPVSIYTAHSFPCLSHGHSHGGLSKDDPLCLFQSREQTSRSEGPSANKGYKAEI